LPYQGLFLGTVPEKSLGGEGLKINATIFVMIRLGFSPCPNDTFIFYALANKKIDTRGLDFSFIIDDVETLNQLAMKRTAEVTKVSCHAFAYVADDYRFLRSGGAFGRGCGPLLVERAGTRRHKAGAEKSQTQTIAIPGQLTTAFLLLKLYISSASDLSTFSFVSMPFHEIMQAVRDGKADAGLIIHESRFTYPDYGLVQVVDLGEWWEKETGLPIPLGGIIAKKSLGEETIDTIQDIIRESVQYAFAHTDEAMPYIKRHAQELSQEVINKHIALYVNDFTIDMGDEGQKALNELPKKLSSL
jgi:1,4-dihydroxy-6-naphthoate synthase